MLPSIRTASLRRWAVQSINSNASRALLPIGWHASNCSTSASVQV
jgi:hypothetical protein